MEYKDLFSILDKNFDMTNFCGQSYWKWEDRVTVYLKDLGYTVDRWWTGEKDSFGPLSRCVDVSKNGIKETFIYG